MFLVDFCRKGTTIFSHIQILGRKNVAPLLFFLSPSVVERARFIKRELLSMIKLPFAPELVFIADEGSDNSKRVNELLSKLDIPAHQESNDDEEI